MTCLDDHTVLRLVAGELAAAALADADLHLDACASCRAVVAEVARAQAPAAGVLARGQLVGRYVVGDTLGAGAMGRVYAAWEPELDRRVALKVLHAEPGIDGRARVVREAQAMARLAHPNVMTVHEVGTVGDAVFVAMELVDGASLRAWGRERRPWREVAMVVRDVARGLAAVHAAGVVHRDIKPDNIVVGADGRARLGDFGLARTRGSTESTAPTRPRPEEEPTQTATVAGTPAYMAPELLGGGSADERSDQFAFAVTAWELLHGARPFAGTTWQELRRAAEAGIGRAPRAVPGWLDALLRRCLHARPGERFPSMAEVADRLDAGLARGRATPWIAGGVAVAALAATAITWLALGGVDARRACTDGAAQVAQVAVHAGVDAASGAAVGRWKARWGEVKDGACRLAPAQPVRAAAQDRCLDRRRDEVAALVAHAPSEIDLVAALAALPDPAECTADAGGADPVPLDPAAAAHVRAVAAGLPAVRASVVAGHPKLFAATIGVLVDRARQSGHAPTLADALLVAAEVDRGNGALVSAADHARDAAAAAERGHADALAADAWIARVAIAGDQRELATAADLAVIAEGAVGRAGDAPAKVARLAHLRGLVHFNRGELAAAGELFTAARAAEVARVGEISVEVARLDAALAQVARASGRLDEAERHAHAALRANSTVYGAGHPTVALDLHNLAGVRRRKHDLVGALEDYRRALAIVARTAGAHSVAAGLTHNSIGLVLMEQGEWDAAKAELAFADSVLAERGHADRAMALHNLGLVAQHAGEHREALATFARASEIYARTIGEGAPAAVRLADDVAVSKAALAGRKASPPARPTIPSTTSTSSSSTTTMPTTTTTVSAPRPDAPPLQPVPPEPERDVGVYGAAQKW
jgi:tetratricopeptide (TPR) repeat protein